MPEKQFRARDQLLGIDNILRVHIQQFQEVFPRFPRFEGPLGSVEELLLVMSC